QEDRLLRTNFLAVAAEDASQHIDFEFLGSFLNVADFRRACGPGRMHANGLGRADKFAKLACDAFDSALWIAHQVRRTAIALGDDPLLLRVLHGDLLLEEVADGD